VNPDGTDMFVKYGAHSEATASCTPREMDRMPVQRPAGDRPDARRRDPRSVRWCLSMQQTIQSKTRPQFNGPAQGGQRQVTKKDLSDAAVVAIWPGDHALSPVGRTTVC